MPYKYKSAADRVARREALKAPRVWSPLELKLREWMLSHPNACAEVGKECNNVSRQFVWAVAYGLKRSTGQVVENALKRRGCPVLEKR